MNDGRQVTVLIVEDNPDDAELAGTYLKRTGLDPKVDTLDDGEQAILYFNSLSPSSSDVPGLVLLDGSMPSRRGREVLEAIHARHPRVKVVMYSGSDSPIEIQAAKDGGADGYIVKPLLPNEIQNVVAQLRELLLSVKNAGNKSGAWTSAHD